MNTRVIMKRFVTVQMYSVSFSLTKTWKYIQTRAIYNVEVLKDHVIQRLNKVSTFFTLSTHS